MRWKTTLVLLLATLGIGAYVSLYDLRQPGREDKERRDKQILSVRKEAIRALQVTTEKAQVRLRLEGSQWVVAPEGWRADAGLVNEILDRLPWLSAERTLRGDSARGENAMRGRENATPGGQNATPLDPKAYGLDPAKGRIEIESEGAAPLTLLLGDTTPVGHRRYIQILGRPEIHVVSTTLYENADQPSEAFRDAFLVPLNPEELRQWDAKSPATALTLVADNGGWRLTQPLTDVADAQAAQELLRKLGQMPIQRFLGALPEGQTLATLGLEPPDTRITLAWPDNRTLTVAFGSAPAGDATLRYAKRSDDAKLYAVRASDLELLFPAAEALRSKRCFAANAQNVSRFRIAFGQTDWTAERATETWTDSATRAALDAKTVEAFLEQLAGLQAAQLIGPASPEDAARYGLAPEQGRITLWEEGAPAQELAIGARVDGGKERYGRLVNRDVVVRLPESLEAVLGVKPVDFVVVPEEPVQVPAEATAQP